MPSLGDRWLTFLKIVLDPFVIGLAILTFLLYLASTSVTPSQTNETVIAALSLVFAVFSGFLGGAIEKRWTALTEERVLVARGKAAIRSLRLLLNKIRSLELRVQEYLMRHNNEDWRENITVEVVKTYLEEVVEACVLLEDEALSSIDNWKDAIPEADVGIQVGLVRELNLERARLVEEARELRAKFEKEKESSVEQERVRTRLIQTIEELLATSTNLSRVDPLRVGSDAWETASGSGVYHLNSDLAEYLASPEGLRLGSVIRFREGRRPRLFFDDWIDADRAHLLELCERKSSKKGEDTSSPSSEEQDDSEVSE